MEAINPPDTRKHLLTLLEILRDRNMLTGGIVRRLHVMILNVIRVGQVPRPTVEITVVTEDGDEWFVWYWPNREEVGARIGLVDDPSGAANVIERVLRDRAEAAAGPRQ